ncbi:ciliary microtubule inner protein 1 [Sylvia atricapilla]|uniref:ciliary microtubule inner protein 1 n=1 Tax=Sylvia atricapilla TaxID=48155 RepID=UPI0033996BE0
MEPNNYIARDNYWKDQIEKEADAAKRWSEKWGFLKTPLEELIGEEKKKDAKPKLQLPDHLQIRPVTPVEKYIKVLPSPPVPKTTQGFIGWRSSIPALALEQDYQIRSCKGAVCKMK